MRTSVLIIGGILLYAYLSRGAAAPGPPAIPSTPDDNPIVVKAKLDLASRLGIAVGKIAVIEVRSVEWPSAALGCPQPGMMYAEVITPGYLIILSAAGTQYPYHTNATGNVVRLCE